MVACRLAGEHDAQCFPSRVLFFNARDLESGQGIWANIAS